MCSELDAVTRESASFDELLNIWQLFTIGRVAETDAFVSDEWNCMSHAGGLCLPSTMVRKTKKPGLTYAQSIVPDD
jgi:hypothetical protein